MLASSPIFMIRVAHGVGTAAKKERSGHGAAMHLRGYAQGLVQWGVESSYASRVPRP